MIQRFTISLIFCFLFLLLFHSGNAQIVEITEFSVSTPDKSISYSIKTNKDRFYTKTTKLVQSDKSNGSERRLEIEGREEFGKNLQSIICDNNYIYFVTTEDGEEAHNKKKVTEKLVLNRFDHKKLDHTKLTIDTPPIEGGEESCFWSFVGQKDDTKFFAYKRVNEESSTIDFVVLGVSSEGKVSRAIKFSTDLSTGKFTRPSYSISEPTNSAILRRLDYNIKISPLTGPTVGGFRTRYERVYTNPTAHSQVIYDNNNDKFLVYGLYGDKPFKTIASVYQGLYFTCFDLEGKKVWSTEQPAGAKLLDEGFFRVHGTPGDRNIEAFSTPQKKIVLVISFNNIIAPYLFSQDGKFLKSDLVKLSKKSSFDINSFVK
jgi:hypothetical protein